MPLIFNGLLSEAEYNAYVVRLLAIMEIGVGPNEAKVLHVYDDGIGHPTIGIGFDLFDSHSRDAVYQAFGVTTDKGLTCY